jgi:hypothetical protein
MMRVAITHDYLNQFGGAERVSRSHGSLSRRPDIIPFFYDEAALGGRFKGKIKRTSFLEMAQSGAASGFIPLFPSPPLRSISERL